MGILDSVESFFRRAPPTAPVMVVPAPNDEPSEVELPSHPEFEAAIANGVDASRAWQVYADWLIASGLQGAPNEKRQFDALGALLGDSTGAKGAPRLKD